MQQEIFIDKFYSNIGENPVFKAKDVHHSWEGDNRNLYDELKHPIIHYVHFNKNIIQNKEDLQDITAIYCSLQNYQALLEIASITLNGIAITVSSTDASGFDASPKNGINLISVAITDGEATDIIDGSSGNGIIAVAITLVNKNPDVDATDKNTTYTFRVPLAVPYGGDNFLYVSNDFSSDDHSGLSWSESKATISSAISEVTTNNYRNYVIYSTDTLADESTLSFPNNTNAVLPYASLLGALSVGESSDVHIGGYMVSADAITIKKNGVLRVSTFEGAVSLSVSIGEDVTDVHDVTSFIVDKTIGDTAVTVSVTILGTSWVYLRLPETITVRFLDSDGNVLSDEARWYGKANGELRFGSSVPLSNNTLYLSSGGNDRNSGRSVELARRSITAVDFTADPYTGINRVVSLDNYAAVSGMPISHSVDNLEYDLRGVDLVSSIRINPNQVLRLKTLDGTLTFNSGNHERTIVEIEEHITGGVIEFVSAVTGNININIRKADYGFSTINRGTNVVALHGRIGQELSAPSIVAPGIVHSFQNHIASSITLGALSGIRGMVIHMYMAYAAVVETGVIGVTSDGSTLVLTNLLEGGLATSYSRLSLSVINAVAILNIASGTAGALEVRYNIMSTL